MRCQQPNEDEGNGGDDEDSGSENECDRFSGDVEYCRDEDLLGDLTLQPTQCRSTLEEVQSGGPSQHEKEATEQAATEQATTQQPETQQSSEQQQAQQKKKQVR